jgi:hypothetical protein
VSSLDSNPNRHGPRWNARLRALVPLMLALNIVGSGSIRFGPVGVGEDRREVGRTKVGLTQELR